MKEEKHFDIVAKQTLIKDVSVLTDDYMVHVCEDEDGKFNDIDCSNTDWVKAFHEQHLTPLQLISKFKDFLAENLPYIKDGTTLREYYEYLISQCNGWEEEDEDIFRE
jgi:hypothetical protein